MKGIDISSYQNNIDFNKVSKSAIEIVYIKATEGLTYKSPQMGSQYSGAKAAGLKIGFYHYLRANNPVLEAKHFLGAIEGLIADCKYVIDVEDLCGQAITKISSNVRQFTDYLISNGKQVCIYTDDSFYANSLNNSVKNIPLWVAHYGVVKPYATKYIGFQYSSLGKIAGIDGPVDLNEFSFDIFINTNTNINLIVKSFQLAVNLVKLTDINGNKLATDGIMGVHTAEVMAKVFITRGYRCELVRFIQQRLISKGFYCGAFGADGDFGWNTLVAVKQFQVSRGLKSDGVVGPLTIVQLLK